MQAGWSQRMGERCERTSERTSEWPSTLRLLLSTHCGPPPYLQEFHEFFPGFWAFAFPSGHGLEVLGIGAHHKRRQLVNPIRIVLQRSQLLRKYRQSPSQKSSGYFLPSKTDLSETIKCFHHEPIIHSFNHSFIRY